MFNKELRSGDLGTPLGYGTEQWQRNSHRYCLRARPQLGRPGTDVNHVPRHRYVGGIFSAAVCAILFAAGCRPDPVQRAEYRGDKAVVVWVRSGCSEADFLRLTRSVDLSALEELAFWESPITDDTLRRVSQLSRLKVLRLCEARITDEGLKHLTSLSDLELLDLRATGISDRGLQHLQKLPRLEHLVLENTRVSDDGLRFLEPLQDLKDLWLHDTRVGDRGMASLGRLRKLEVLTLDRTAVTDEGMVHLAGLHNLKELTMKRTAISDAGLASLQGLSRLEELDVMETQVTEAGADRLRRTLPNTKVVHGPHPWSLREREAGLETLSDNGVDQDNDFRRLNTRPLIPPARCGLAMVVRKILPR